MDASLKKLDLLCVSLLQSNEAEVSRSKELLALKTSVEPLTVGDIIQVLQESATKEKLAQYAYQKNIVDAIFELCILTPITEQEYEFFELFTPFWGIIEELCRYKDMIRLMEPATVQLAVTLRQSVLHWLLQVNPNNQKEKFNLLKKMLKIAARLCINELFASSFVLTRGVEEVLEAVKRYFDDPEIITQCLQILIEVAEHPKLRAAQVNLGVLASIVTFYKIYTENINVLYHCASLTSLLVIDPSASSMRIEIMSILSCQLQGLKKFKLNDSLIEKDLHSLAAIIFQNQSYQQMFIKSGSLDLLPEFVKEYIESPKISQALCLIINSLSYRNLQLKELLGKRGFVQILITILTHYTSYDNYHFQTVKNALKSLGNLSLFETNAQSILTMEFVRICHQFILNRYIVEDPLELQVQQLIDYYQFFCDLSLDILYTICQPSSCPYFLLEQTFKEGLIDFILLCVKLNRKSITVLQKAVDTLGPFLGFDCAVNYFCESDGFGIICGLIQIVYFDLNIVLSCFQVLVQVLTYDQEKVDLVMGYKINIDMVKTIKQISIQKAHTPITLNLFEEIVSLAMILSCDSVKCRIMWSSQFLESSLELLQDPYFNSNKHLVIQFIEILLMYSQMQEASVIITEYGGKLLIKIMGENITVYEIIDESTNLILNLLELPSNVDLLMENPLLDIMLAIIYTYIQSDFIVQKVLQCYERICHLGESYRENVKQYCLDPLVKISESNPEYPEQTKMIRETIQLISRVRRPQRMSFIQLVTKEARDYLMKGVLCRLIKDNGASSDLVFFVSNDLQVIQCKHPSHKITKQKWRMRIDSVEEIVTNYHEDKILWTNSPFSKSSGIFKKKPEPARCFSIKGKGTLKVQQVDKVQMIFFVCAPTILDKNKLIDYLRVVIQQLTNKVL